MESLLKARGQTHKGIISNCKGLTVGWWPFQRHNNINSEYINIEELKYYGGSRGDLFH